MDATRTHGFRLTAEVASGPMPDDVVGVTEIAKLLKIAKRTAAKYVDLPSFPEPLAQLATGRVWRRADVEAWAKAHLPLPPGRPRKQAEQ